MIKCGKQTDDFSVADDTTILPLLLHPNVSLIARQNCCHCEKDHFGLASKPTYGCDQNLATEILLQFVLDQTDLTSTSNA
jgi:hypothetical protein